MTEILPELALETEQARIVRVIDFETTGLPEDEGAEIIEYGFVDLELSASEINNFCRGFIKPQIPITPKTMAVHHITNEEVADAPPRVKEIRKLSAGMRPADIFCAHNIKMEKHFYSGEGHRWICTLKCALVLWPEFESHSNQAVRYALGADLDKSLAEPPHRALPDAYVTAHILRECLKHKTVGELVEITSNPILLTRINFGKHRGKSFEELANTQYGYLKWVLGQKFDEDTIFTVKHWLRKR